jgi:hypothetical protein
MEPKARRSVRAPHPMAQPASPGQASASLSRVPVERSARDIIVVPPVPSAGPGPLHSRAVVDPIVR